MSGLAVIGVVFIWFVCRIVLSAKKTKDGAEMSINVGAIEGWLMFALVMVGLLVCGLEAFR